MAACTEAGAEARARAAAPASDEAALQARRFFPVRAVAALLLSSLLAIGAAAVLTVLAFHAGDERAEALRPAIQARLELRQLEQSLRDAAQLGVLTGEQRMAQRHAQDLARLRQVLQLGMPAPASPQLHAALLGAAQAREQLVPLEQRALQHGEQGAWRQGWELLSGPQYRRACDALDAALAHLERAVEQHLGQQARHQAQLQAWSRAAAAVALALVLATTAVLLRCLRRWRQALQQRLQLACDDQARLARESQSLRASLAASERMVQRVGLMTELASLLHASHSLQEIGAAVAHLGPQLFLHSSGALYVRQRGSDTLELVSQWGQRDDGVATFPASACWSIRRGVALSVAAGSQVFRCGHTPPGLRADHARTCIPLQAQGELIGLLEVVSLSSAAAGTELDAMTLQVARAMAQEAALVLANTMLRTTLQEQSIRDPLTGLFNRRFFDEALQLRLNHARREGVPVSLLMIDVDHFKRINDTHGHAVGDVVLRQVALLVRDQLRNSDVVCRFGGEEFAVCLPSASLAAAQGLGERVLDAVRRLEVREGAAVLKAGSITVSIGLASYPRQAATTDELLKAADKALYAAKEAGRNRLVVSAVAGSRGAAP